MATVTSTVLLRDPETLEVVVVKPGDVVPAWADITTPGLVVDDEPKKPAAKKAPAKKATSKE